MKTLLVLLALVQAPLLANANTEISIACDTINTVAVLAKDNVPYWVPANARTIDADNCYDAIRNEMDSGELREKLVQRSHNRSTAPIVVAKNVAIFRTDAQFADFINFQEEFCYDVEGETVEGDCNHFDLKNQIQGFRTHFMPLWKPGKTYVGDEFKIVK